MHQYQILIERILQHNFLEDGTILRRNTRSGKVYSKFDETVRFDLTKGFPAVTTKKLAWNSVVGELLWFLSGSTNLDKLKHYSDLEDNDWTIWTQDAERYGGKGNKELGAIYGAQWRDFNGDGIDQVGDLIKSLQDDFESRRHVVTAWNPSQISDMALPPCHMFFQCYVNIDEKGYRNLDLKWYQRSVDVFLGLPFNIASYALLLIILAKLTGCRPRYLTGSLGDCHIYDEHLPQVKELLRREPYVPCGLKIPHFKSLDELLKKYTARNFHLLDYQHHGKLKGKLLVGE